MSSNAEHLDDTLIAAVGLATDGPTAATREHVQEILEQQGVALESAQVGALLEDLARRSRIERVDAAPGDGLPTFGFRPVV